MRRAFLLLAALAGCHRGVSNVTIENRTTHWEQNGFVEMVPPIRPPSTVDEHDVVKVWLKIPDGGKLVMSAGSLRVPAGTIADRVETRGQGNVDVRGTRFGERGAEFFHVYHSDANTPGAPVTGWEWPRGDDKLQKEATDKLVASLAGQPQAEIEMLRGFNECARCHEHERPPVTRVEVSAPRRATDGSGLFELLAVLRDDAPLELNRPRDMNVGLPYFEVRCSNGERAELQTRPDGARRFACKDGSVPVARLDVAQGVAAKDEHALQVCKSRRYLYDRMDEAARAEFRAGFVACGIEGGGG